ncbi:MAG TPA: DUF1254 domain-containing protein [Candidatus Acidoferrum sp.]|nr:DUF1254 domain-containing protein [Candidatus Acidoferrum sp.]
MRRAWGVLGAIIAFGLIVSLSQRTQAAKDPPVLAKEALDIGTEAYLYGYPLVTMEMTRRVMTNVAKPDGNYAPMGQFALIREYPTAAFYDVTAPNADTLYSLAWLDVTREPYVFTIPDSKGRYYLMPMLDGWTDVFQVPGKRTTGTMAQKYAITGPGWKGTLPDGVTEYKSSTNMVWILGRTYCTGTPQDYREVHAFQDQLSLAPLSSYGKAYTPPAGKVDPRVDMKTPVRDQVNGLGALEYFSLLATLMKDNPPVAADAPIVARMAKIGIVPGQAFDSGGLDPVVANSLADAPKTALSKIATQKETAGTHVNGWIVPRVAGLYGTDYLQRATVAAFGLGANRLEDAVYPFSEADSTGLPYNGANRYVLHFGKGELPPVNAFWSLTMYNDQFFFVDNPLNRYTLSQRNKLKFNPDGSVDLYLQAANPGPGKENNWLPAPNDGFILMLRMYWPNPTAPSILDGSWKPPAVTKME